MDDLVESISEKSSWPMMHVFVPAIITIYTKNIWILISIIYIFESLEYLFSVLANLNYWSDLGSNALVSDIIMGLAGYWLINIIGDLEYKHDKIPWYAVLKYREGYWKWYEKFQPYLHVVLAASASAPNMLLVVTDSVPEESPYGFIIFGPLFVLVALLFGKDRFAKQSAILITLISAISINIRFTPIVSFTTVFGYFLSINLIKKYINDVTHKNYEKVKQNDPKHSLVF